MNILKKISEWINPQPKIIEQDFNVKYPITHIVSDNGFYFAIVTDVEFSQRLYNKQSSQFFCCIIGNKILFPRKSGAKYLTIK